MTDKHTHSVESVKIDETGVTIVCTCGWESDPGVDETAAKADFDIHLSEVAVEST